MEKRKDSWGEEDCPEGFIMTPEFTDDELREIRNLVYMMVAMCKARGYKSKNDDLRKGIKKKISDYFKEKENEAKQPTN